MDSGLVTSSSAGYYKVSTKTSWRCTFFAIAMDEASLEEALKGYKEQLDQIQLILPSADELTKLELYDLEKDLKELISVTEESLFSVKKQRLLLSLEKDDEDAVNSSVQRNDLQSLGESSSTSSFTEEQFAQSDEPSDDFVGTKCRVKYTQEWGSFQYHNAMVLAVEEEDSEMEETTYKARVLFLNPIHKSMVTCKFFMNGKCDYTEEEDCRYSHGYLVDINDLQEYQEPDFTKLHVGGQCLAQHSDGVWYKANITDLHDEQVTISFDTKKETLTLDYHMVVPIDTHDEGSGDSDNESDPDSDKNESGFVQLSYKSSSMNGPIGEWEEHTKGIGSKLMAKMGYVFGKGLGKDGEGRVEPVEIIVLPPGKSLDKIAELREKGFIKNPIKKKPSVKKLIAAEVREQDKKERENAAFNLINGLTNRSKSKKGTNSGSVKISVEDTYKSMKRDLVKQKHHIRHREKHKKHDSSNVNIQLFKNSEKITPLKKKLGQLKESLARNLGDTKVSRTIKYNIAETEKELERLHRIGESLQTKAHMKNQSKKLTIF